MGGGGLVAEHRCMPRSILIISFQNTVDREELRVMNCLGYESERWVCFTTSCM